MSPQFDLSSVDTDGAIREAEAAVAGDTRASFFRKAAIGGGAAMSSGALVAMLPEAAMGRPSKKQDLEILNYALTLEYLEAAFYNEAVQSNALSGAALELARLILDHENTHVTALRQTIKGLGGKPVKSPKFDFQGSNREQGKFIRTALVLENTGVRAYLGQAARLKSNALLNAAASIVTVEARHAAAVAYLLNDNPYAGQNSITPYGAFDRRTRKRKILGEVESTGFIVG